MFDLAKVQKIVTEFKDKHGVKHVGVAHVVPVWMLAAVFVALMVLTWVTVAVTYVDLGKLNLLVALLVASIKALLVAFIFMHLRWDRPLNGIIFVFAILFVMLFVGFVLIDSAAYFPEITNWTPPE